MDGITQMRNDIKVNNKIEDTVGYFDILSQIELLS